MQVVTELLSPAKRKAVYIIYGLAGVILGATQTAFSAAESASPLWLTVAFAVFGYVGVAFGLVAAQNVSTEEVAVVTVADESVVLVGENLPEYLGDHGELDGLDPNVVAVVDNTAPVNV